MANRLGPCKGVLEWDAVCEAVSVDRVRGTTTFEVCLPAHFDHVFHGRMMPKSIILQTHDGIYDPGTRIRAIYRDGFGMDAVTILEPFWSEEDRKWAGVKGVA